MKLVTTIKEYSGPGRPCAAALGFFDGVHLGHRAVLEPVANARKQNLLPAAFSFVTGGTAPKGKTGGLIYSEAQRVQLLEELGMELVLMPPFEEIAEMGPEEFVDFLCGTLGVRFVSCGEDYRFSRGASADAQTLRKLCAERGVEVLIHPEIVKDKMRISSTRIRGLLREGGIPSANRLLGQRYFIDTQVGEGQRIGHSLGFPTINQPFAENVAPPCFGVYATLAKIQNRWLPAVTNVGSRPTIGEALPPRAETYILGFSGNLYGKRVRVEFLYFIRKERRFSSLEELKKQIASDCGTAAALLQNPDA